MWRSWSYMKHFITKVRSAFHRGFSTYVKSWGLLKSLWSADFYYPETLLLPFVTVASPQAAQHLYAAEGCCNTMPKLYEKILKIQKAIINEGKNWPFSTIISLKFSLTLFAPWDSVTWEHSTTNPCPQGIKWEEALAQRIVCSPLRSVHAAQSNLEARGATQILSSNSAGNIHQTQYKCKCFLWDLREQEP